MCPVSRIKNFFTNPFQLAYAVVRKQTFLNYISEVHEEYFFATLSSDCSWYCAALSAGNGVYLKSLHILRLFHGGNTKTYGQTPGDIFEALVGGAVGADAVLISQRLLSLANHGQMRTSDHEHKKLLQTTVLMITLLPLKEFWPSKQGASRNVFTFLSFLPYRIYLRMYSLKVIILNFKSIRILDSSLRFVES
jgi:hypothetical protein